VKGLESISLILPNINDMSSEAIICGIGHPWPQQWVVWKETKQDRGV